MTHKKLLLHSVFLGLTTINASSQEVQIPSDDLSFEEQVEFFSEERLGIRPKDGGAIAVGSNGCEIADELAAKFDKLIPISSSARSKAEERHAKFGLPKIETEKNLELLLHHKEYVVSYNTDLRLPVYATYRLDKSDIVKGDRRDCFREDHRLKGEARSTLKDYDEPVFDRGHLVPVGDMHRKFSTSVNTFYLSNMMPHDQPHLIGPV